MLLAPVALLVDRGYGNGPQALGPIATVAQRVCIVFFGEADDGMALELGDRLSEHPAVKVTVVRFIHRDGLEEQSVLLRPSTNNERSYKSSTVKTNHQKEKELDEKAVPEFRSKRNGMVEYIEKVTSNIVEEVLEMGRSGDYGHIVVGKDWLPSNMVTKLAESQAEQAELGPIGEILASSVHGVVSSVLVIQQHNLALEEEAPVSRVHDNVV